MLKLKNIKSSNGIIYADYEPEKSGITGKISIRISDKEVISSVVSEYDKEFPIYLQHAILALKKLVGIKELPKEKLVMWY